MKRHLTLTGFYAGLPICCDGVKDFTKTPNDVHAAYAPLELSDFRATVCPECLFAWAESYKIDDGSIAIDAPQWVRDILEAVETEGGSCD